MCRKAECTWKKTHAFADWTNFKASQSKHIAIIMHVKQQYHSHLISSTKDNPKIWKRVDNLLHRRQPLPLPKASSHGVSLSSAFAITTSRTKYLTLQCLSFYIQLDVCKPLGFKSNKDGISQLASHSLPPTSDNSLTPVSLCHHKQISALSKASTITF